MTAAACRVTRLRLHDFRNYDEVTLAPGPRLNVIAGPNAQGKTNLLEAVATIALTRSPRAPSAAELLRWGSERCQAEADVQRGERRCDLVVRFEQLPGAARVSRATLIDGKARPAGAVLGLCPVVLFWPEDLQLVKGGPEGRRRLLDVLLAQLSPRVAAHLSRYRRVLQQRNALLHRLRVDGSGADALPGFTRELARHAAPIVVARAEALAALGPLAAAALTDISAGAEVLQLRYAPSHGDSCDTEEAVEVALLTALDRRAAEELARGVTVAGPHRDDVEVLLDGRPARHTASQGQQRSIVLACKIAEMRHVEAVAGVAPVVLLDDVLSELDASRRDYLLEALARGRRQVLVTTTDAPRAVPTDGDVRHFRVRAGRVTEDSR